MATSRTGTTKWKRVRLQALRRDRRNNVTHCRYCNTELDYIRGKRPNSAEPDHIVPHSRGGQDTLENLMTVCRTCNISKGDRPAPKTRTVLKAKPLKTSRTW